MFDVEEAYYTLVEKAEQSGRKKKHPKNCDCPECKKRRARRKKIAIGAGAIAGVGLYKAGKEIKRGYDEDKNHKDEIDKVYKKIDRAMHKKDLYRKVRGGENYRRDVEKFHDLRKLQIKLDNVEKQYNDAMNSKNYQQIKDAKLDSSVQKKFGLPAHPNEADFKRAWSHIDNLVDKQEKRMNKAERIEDQLWKKKNDLEAEKDRKVLNRLHLLDGKDGILRGIGANIHNKINRNK